MSRKPSSSSARSGPKDILMPSPKRSAQKPASAKPTPSKPALSKPASAKFASKATPQKSALLASSKTRKTEPAAKAEHGSELEREAPHSALPAKKRVSAGSHKAELDAPLPRNSAPSTGPSTAKPAKAGTKTKAATGRAANRPLRALGLGTATPAPAPVVVVEIIVTTEELWTAYREEVTRSKGEDSLALQDLRNQLMERHLPLVRYIAERLLQTLPKSIELDDLISAGMFGLMDAIRGFDQSRGIKFKTYCSTRIRGAILDQLRSQDWVPRLVRLKATRIERAYQKLQGAFGREPTHSELAQELTMGHDELQGEIEQARPKTMYSLSEKWEDGEDDGSLEKVEVLVDRTAVDPVHELNRRDLMLFLTKSLSDKERFIISMYYERGLTMREIGELLALTESRVCQIHSNVMNRLKDHLEKREDGLIA
jgi:RNA polymerase sigma factor for flagellar operon FliA